MSTKGGCFCGKIRYEFDAEEVMVADCHCTMCRRTSGAAFATWLVVPIEIFRYTSGEAKELKSSEQGTRYFCSECSTPIACVNTSHPEIIDITLGSLDKPENYRPTFSVFEDTRLPHL